MRMCCTISGDMIFHFQILNLFKEDVVMIPGADGAENRKGEGEAGDQGTNLFAEAQEESNEPTDHHGHANSQRVK